MSSLTEIRAALRTARDDEGLTLDALAANSGVDRATIHRIENIVSYPEHAPELDTILRLVGQGLKRNMSEFFSEYVERVPDLNKGKGEKDLPVSVAKHDNAASPHGAEVSRIDVALLQAVVVSATAELVAAVDRLNTTLASVLSRLEAHDGPTASARPPQTRNRARGHSSHRKTG